MELATLICGEIAGTLRQDEHGLCSFVYAPTYRGAPLSLTMPLSNRTYGHNIVRPFLFGLLPDSQEQRRAIAAEHDVASNNPVALLCHIGLDCAGAVQFCRADQLDANKTIVEPDVMIVCDRDKLYKNRIYGAPDFILEVLSKSTRRRDMVIKLQKYANAGVKEYWMVDIEGRRVFVYIFDEENYPVIYGFDSKVPVYIWGGQCEIDFSEVYNYIRFLIES